MGSISHELSFDIKQNYIPNTITDFLRNLSTIGNGSDKLSKLENYIKSLEDEMRKIDAFKRELPLCMLLLNDAITYLKDESMQRISVVDPVLEEFIPLKNKKCDEENNGHNIEDSRDKKNWMSSVQLWNTDDHSTNEFTHNQKQNSKVEIKQTNKKENNQSVIEDPFQTSKSRLGGRAFAPFKGSAFPPTTIAMKEDKGELPVYGLSLVTPGIKNLKEDSGSSGSKTSCSRTVSSTPNVQSNLRTGLQPQQQQTSRKQRRCWSPELHRRFVSALQQLGGSQVATPKQIRELMQVDGLTNDEVKSHLQKYRLHTRRVPTSQTAPANQSMVVLGGLWMTQDQYGESTKQTSSQSGSPQGPLQLGCTTGGNSTTCGDSMEDDEDEKSESYSWKSHKTGKDDV